MANDEDKIHTCNKCGANLTGFAVNSKGYVIRVCSKCIYRERDKESEQKTNNN